MKTNHTRKKLTRSLEETGKIYLGKKGIVWIHNPSKKLAKAIKKGVEH